MVQKGVEHGLIAEFKPFANIQWPHYCEPHQIGD